MAYEVIKTINGRGYKYGVQRERDAATGKVRNRWTYLGRVDERTVRPKRERSATSREALLDALARLLERASLDEVTVDAVALEAGVAHGTFYRHFRDKGDALYALMDRVRSTLTFPDVTMAAEPASRDDVRAALRSYVQSALQLKLARPGMVRAWYALAERDPKVGAEQVERRRRFSSMFVAFLGEVGRRGFGEIVDPLGTATAVFALFSGLVRAALDDNAATAQASIDAVAEMIDRAIFTTAPDPVPATRGASVPRPSRARRA